MVTAKGVGTASISAFVTIEGKTLSDSYPVKVMPNLTLSNITVDGKKISGFKPEVHGYSYLMASSSSAAPKVQATQAGNEITVGIEQAGSVPGTTLITLTDNITGEKSEYAVSFGLKSVSDEFNGKSIGKQWSWIRENAANWSLIKSLGSMVITSQKGDIQGASNNAENILLQPANTDWTIESKLVFSGKPIKPNQQGGLIVYQDDDNYVKLVYGNAQKGFRGSEELIELVVENHGSQYSAANIKTLGLIKDNYAIVLKLEKKGSNYTAYYSIGGKDFKLLGSTETVLSDIKTGLIACDGVTMGRSLFPEMMDTQNKKEEPKFEIICDYFHIVNTGIK